MKYFEDIALAYIFVMMLMIPVIKVLYSAYGLFVTLFTVAIPLLWFVMDSDVSHHQVDKYL